MQRQPIFAKGSVPEIPVRVEELVPKAKLSKFFHMLAPQEKFDIEALSTLSEIGEEFVLNVLEDTCQLASLKDNKELTVEDMLFILEKTHNIKLPSPNANALNS